MYVYKESVGMVQTLPLLSWLYRGTKCSSKTVLSLENMPIAHRLVAQYFVLSILNVPFDIPSF